MNFFLITHPTNINNEGRVINELFNEGLDMLHLRKPDHTIEETEKLLNAIDTKHHLKVVLHQHYSMGKKFGINRIHFSEKTRLTATEQELKEWKEKNFILSTSIHTMSDYEKLSDTFSYTFLGPVFESISKPGYKPPSEEIIKLKENKNRRIKIIAIGGITATTIEIVKQANFDGAAMLGAIWNDTINAIEVLKKCQQSANM